MPAEDWSRGLGLSIRKEKKMWERKLRTVEDCGAVVYIEIVRTVQKIQVEKETVRTDLCLLFSKVYPQLFLKNKKSKILTHTKEMWTGNATSARNGFPLFS